MEVRTVGRDEAFLSHSFGARDRRDLGLGTPGTDYCRTCGRSIGCSASSTHACTGSSCIS